MSLLKVEYHGINHHRLRQNKLETKFALAWQEINLNKNGGTRTIDYILNEKDQRFVDKCSKRDLLVANTIIQWLGSPVGESFVRSVLEKGNKNG